MPLDAPVMTTLPSTSSCVPLKVSLALSSSSPLVPASTTRPLVKPAPEVQRHLNASAQKAISGNIPEIYSQALLERVRKLLVTPDP